MNTVKLAAFAAAASVVAGGGAHWDSKAMQGPSTGAV